MTIKAAWRISPRWDLPVCRVLESSGEWVGDFFEDTLGKELFMKSITNSAVVRENVCDKHGHRIEPGSGYCLACAMTIAEIRGDKANLKTLRARAKAIRRTARSATARSPSASTEPQAVSRSTPPMRELR